MKGDSLENLTLSLGSLLMLSKTSDVMEIGNFLEQSDADQLTDGGYFVWKIEETNLNEAPEFYSNKFRQSLGFSGEDDFPSLATSWMDYIDKNDLQVAIDNLHKALQEKNRHPYYQVVNYTTKNKERLKVVCSGVVVEKDEEKFLVGTHKVL